MADGVHCGNPKGIMPYRKPRDGSEPSEACCRPAQFAEVDLDAKPPACTRSYPSNIADDDVILPVGHSEVCVLECIGKGGPSKDHTPHP